MYKNYNTLITSFKLFLLTFIFLNVLSSSKVLSTGTVYVNQDFDNTSFPPNNWMLTNTSSYNWIRTTYASGYGLGTSCAVADFYDYPSGNFEMTTSTFPLTTAGDSLVFDHAYASGSNEVDRLEIFISSDNGVSWNTMVSLTGGVSGPLATASPTYDLFVPTPSQWATKSYFLPIGTNKIKFTGITAFGNNLYLDNNKNRHKVCKRCRCK